MIDRFAELCRAFDGIDVLMDDGSWKSPSPWPPTEMALRDYLTRHYKCLPPPYDRCYGDLLLHKVSDTAQRLVDYYNSRLNELWLEPYARSYTLLRCDSLLGAATAWSGRGTLTCVQHFQALVSDLFESFVTKANPVLDPLRLSDKLPPLVTFATQPSLGPAALNADEVKRFCGSDISIISQPARYADYPILWGVLAHETCGHAVTHAIPGLADDLIRGLSKTPGLGAYAGLWRVWAEEAAADVYGLLNVGPSFVLSLAAWLKMAKKSRTIGTAISILGGDADDAHPADLLRLYVLRGAVEKLTNFSRSKSAWIKTIDATIASAAPGIAYIDVDHGDPLHPKPLPLKQLADAAQQAGAAIVSMKLSCLKNHTIQEIETWDEKDEAIALRVKRAAVKGSPLTGLGADDAHLIAGATMALCEDASRSYSINQLLVGALEDSYQRDAVFRGWPGKAKCPMPRAGRLQQVVYKSTTSARRKPACATAPPPRSASTATSRRAV